MDATTGRKQLFRKPGRAAAAGAGGMKITRVTVNPDLHLSETTALIKAKRFLRQMAVEIDQRNVRADRVQQVFNAKYRKPITIFRALYKDPRVEDLLVIASDEPKRIHAERLLHRADAQNNRAYFCLSTMIVTNKATRVMPSEGPMDIAISTHTLARMLERCSINLNLDIKNIRALLFRLLVSALLAEYDENDMARIGVKQYPNMIFVCRKNLWLKNSRYIPAIYTIVTYFEK